MSASPRQFRGPLQPAVPRVPYAVRHGSTPGPGAYETYPSFGTKERLSPRKTEPAYTIYHQNREEYVKTYLSANLNAKLPRLLTKHCDFINKYGIGHQPLSQFRDEPIHGFGTSTRQHREFIAQPGSSPRKSPRSASPRYSPRN